MPHNKHVRYHFWVLALLCASLASAEGSSTVSLNNGVTLTVLTSLGSPTGTTRITTEMSRATGDSFYRIFYDQNKLVVFAYELEVGRSGDSSFVITTKPAGVEFAQRYPGADGGKPVPTFSTARDWNLASTRSVDLEVFTLEGQGLKVVDTVRVVLANPGQNPGAADLGTGLRFSGLRVAVGGKVIAGPSRGSVSGKFAMFYIPGRGGFFFTAEPVAPSQFLKAGSVDRTEMHFTIDNVQYDVTAVSPILGQSGRGELWVYYDPQYRPRGNLASQDPRDDASKEFFTGAGDSMDWWL